ncbi:MAG: GNAT family N-acetyltransferase [Chloroflexi bacterium]|nr:GNAT family N-acetyltransferase [Chloroflexota bacterium]
MYGVESFVHPRYQGCGIGSTLMDARFDLARRLNLRGMVAGSMIMDYHTVADTMSAAQYVREVVAGQRFDTNLSKQLRKGFRVRNLIPNYAYDPRTLNWAVAIVWHNPAYRADQPILRVAQPGRYIVPLRSKRATATLRRVRA